MKINESGRINSLNAYKNTSNTRDTKAAGKVSKAKDDVQISAEAKELLESRRTGDVNRAQRLEQLKTEVRSGTYHVDANKIAEKLLPYLK